MATKSSAVIGSLNIPNVPPVAPAWPSALVVAQQSVSVIVLKPARKVRRSDGVWGIFDAASCPSRRPCASWTQRNSS